MSVILHMSAVGGFLLKCIPVFSTLAAAEEKMLQ